MKNKKHIWVGVFIAAGIIVFTTLFAMIRPSFGDGKTIIKVGVSDIQGIVRGSCVRLAGSPVGKVSVVKEIRDAREQPATPFGDPCFYEVTLKVDSHVKVFSCDRIVIASPNFMGEKSVLIIPGLLADGKEDVTDRFLFAESPGSVQDKLGKAELLVDKITTFLRNNEEVVNAVLCKLVDVIESVDDRLKDTDKIFKDLVDCSAKLRSVADKTYDVVTDFAAMDPIKEIKEAFQKFSLCLDSFKDKSDQLYPDLVQVSDNLNHLLSTISRHGLLFQMNKKWKMEQRFEQKAALLKNKQQKEKP